MRKIGFKKSLYRNQIIMGYLLLIPAVAFFIFFCYSLLQAFHYSTLDWDGVTAATYVGLQNYVELFTDPVFWKAFINNVCYTIGILIFGVASFGPPLVITSTKSYTLKQSITVYTKTIFITDLICGSVTSKNTCLLLAYILSRPGIKGRTLFRSVYFFPRKISAVVYGAVWKWIYDPRMGLVSKIIDLFGGNGSDFAITGNVKTAMLGITITGGWTYFGFCMVIFIAAFMGTDLELEEAAKLDGANSRQVFFEVTLPQIKSE